MFSVKTHSNIYGVHPSAIHSKQTQPFSIILQGPFAEIPRKTLEGDPDIW